MGTPMRESEPLEEINALLEQWGRWVMAGRPGPGRYVCPLGRLRGSTVATPAITDDQALRVDAAMRALTVHDGALVEVLSLWYVFGVSHYTRLARRLGLGRAGRLRAREMLLAGLRFVAGFLAQQEAGRSG